MYMLPVGVINNNNNNMVNRQGDRRCNGHADDCLVYSPYYQPHWSKDVVLILIMPLCWMASGSVGACGSQRCKAKWTYWALRQRCCAGGTLVIFCETDRENCYENQSPVFSYERSPTVYIIHNTQLNIHIHTLCNFNAILMFSLYIFIYYGGDIWLSGRGSWRL